MPRDVDKSFPESDICEWKWSWRDEYMKWMSAFANTGGGTLHIGVNDDGYVVGLKNHRKLLEELPNKFHDKLHITPYVRLHHADSRGENIRYKAVPAGISSKEINQYASGTYVPSNEKQKEKLARWEKEIPVSQDPDGCYYYIEIEVPHYHNLVTYDGVAYVRSGSTLQVLEGRDLELAVIRSTGMSWDAVPVKTRELDYSAIEAFRRKSVEKKRLTPEMVAVSDSVLLDKLNLMTDDGQMTRAAAMLFSNPEKIIGGSYIKIGYFAPPASRGMNTADDVIYHDDVRGPLITQADKAVDLLYSKYMKALIDYDGLQRVETYMIPQDAMREIILNAVAHKNYPSRNPIQIKVYDDHITVMNEGFWPFDRLKVEDAYTGQHNSYPGNPTIAEGIYMAGDIETWGTGFDKIRNACTRYGSPLPKVEATDGSVTITVTPGDQYLRLLKPLSAETNKTDSAAYISSGDAAYSRMLEILSRELKESEKKKMLPLVEFFKLHHDITSEQAGKIVGKSTATATRYLNRLIELDVVEKIGDSYRTVYVLKGARFS